MSLVVKSNSFLVMEIRFICAYRSARRTNVARPVLPETNHFFAETLARESAVSIAREIFVSISFRNSESSLR